MVVVMKMMVMSINGNADNNVVTLQCGIAYNWTGQGGAEHEGGVDGEGEHSLQSISQSVLSWELPSWSPSSSS